MVILVFSINSPNDIMSCLCDFNIVHQFKVQIKIGINCLFYGLSSSLLLNPLLLSTLKHSSSFIQRE